MSTSSVAVAGTNATAQQYNDLRLDAITKPVRVLMPLAGVIVVADSQIAIPIGWAMTLTKIYHKILSGTSATFTIKRTSDTVKSAIDATTTFATETSGLSNTSFVSGDVLYLNITAVTGSPADLSIIVEFNETR